jgi:hypothetical protein
LGKRNSDFYESLQGTLAGDRRARRVSERARLKLVPCPLAQRTQQAKVPEMEYHFLSFNKILQTIIRYLYFNLRATGKHLKHVYIYIVPVFYNSPPSMEKETRQVPKAQL